MTVRLKAGEPARVDFGDSDLEPEVTMSMDADTAHRFWLGGVNVTVALARGQMRANGPVAKMLKLVPLTKPVFPRYKALLRSRAARTWPKRERRGVGGDRPGARRQARRRPTSRSAG